MANRTPPRPPPRPLVPPPAPVRPRAAGGVAGVGVAPRPRVVLPPLVFGNGSPPGGGPTRSRKQRKQRKQTRKQKQQKN